jgi:hypothetical protein
MLKIKGFWKQLIEYEKMLFGSNSVKIMQTTIGEVPSVYENEIKTMIFVKNGQAINGLADNSLKLNTNSSTNTSSSSSPNKPQSSSSETKSSIPKLNGSSSQQQLPSLRSSLLSNEIEFQQVASKLNKANYTTTYRSSYHKPF